MKLEIEDFAGQSFGAVMQEYQLLESAMKWKEMWLNRLVRMKRNFYPK